MMKTNNIARRTLPSFNSFYKEFYRKPTPRVPHLKELCDPYLDMKNKQIYLINHCSVVRLDPSLTATIRYELEHSDKCTLPLLFKELPIKNPSYPTSADEPFKHKITKEWLDGFLMQSDSDYTYTYDCDFYKVHKLMRDNFYNPSYVNRMPRRPYLLRHYDAEHGDVYYNYNMVYRAFKVISNKESTDNITIGQGHKSTHKDSIPSHNYTKMHSDFPVLMLRNTIKSDEGITIENDASILPILYIDSPLGATIVDITNGSINDIEWT